MTGEIGKSLLYKGDAARACRMVALSPAAGIRVFNVSGPPCTMREVVSTISRNLGRHPLPGRVPASYGFGIEQDFFSLANKETEMVFMLL